MIKCSLVNLASMSMLRELETYGMSIFTLTPLLCAIRLNLLSILILIIIEYSVLAANPKTLQNLNPT